MNIPKIDLIVPENIAKEVFDDDRWVKDRFAETLAEEVIEIRGGACTFLCPFFSAANSGTLDLPVRRRDHMDR